MRLPICYKQKSVSCISAQNLQLTLLWPSSGIHLYRLEHILCVRIELAGLCCAYTYHAFVKLFHKYQLQFFCGSNHRIVILLRVWCLRLRISMWFSITFVHTSRKHALVHCSLKFALSLTSDSHVNFTQGVIFWIDRFASFTAILKSRSKTSMSSWGRLRLLVLQTWRKGLIIRFHSIYKWQTYFILGR